MAAITSFIAVVLMTFTVLLSGVFAQNAGDQDQLSDQGNVETVIDAPEEVRADSQIPLQLTIDLVKSEFAPGEKVEFGLSLMNRGVVNLKVKELSEATTYCLFNGARWGSMEPSGSDNVILVPGEALRIKLRFTPTQVGKLDIFCSYGMGFKGIRPNAQVIVNIN